jgi:hypothetical protein
MQLADLLVRRLIRRRELHGYRAIPMNVMQLVLWPEAA